MHWLTATAHQREENFFSKAVTHVITTRPIPPDDVVKAAAAVPPPTFSEESERIHPKRTIGPSIMGKRGETSQSNRSVLPNKAKFTFEAPVKRRPDTQVQPDPEPHNYSPFLVRARVLGIKVWGLDKLQRVLTTMLDTNFGPDERGVAGRGNTVTAAKPDLSKLLQNEQLTGPSDRDTTVGTTDLVMFKGPYLYIYDMDERTRPIMARDYPKVLKREDGEWPQFRSTSVGKCPFLDDPSGAKQDAAEPERAREKRTEDRTGKQPQGGARTRPATMQESTGNQKPTHVNRGRAMSDMQSNANKVGRRDDPTTRDVSEASKIASVRRGNVGQTSKCMSAAYGGARGNAEPVASGVQPSNITSAIRSQMVSSTAAAPGAKAGTSREVHELKRKVLERNAKPNFSQVCRSIRMAHLAQAANAPSALYGARTTSTNAQEKLGQIEEGDSASEGEVNIRRPNNSIRQRRVEKKVLKPGYCENCQEKFEDFEEVRMVVSDIISGAQANGAAAHGRSKASQVCNEQRELGRVG